MGTLLLFGAWIGVNVLIDRIAEQRKERLKQRRARAKAPVRRLPARAGAYRRESSDVRRLA